MFAACVCQDAILRGLPWDVNQWWASSQTPASLVEAHSPVPGGLATFTVEESPAWLVCGLLTLSRELSGADLQLASVLSLGSPGFHLYAVLCLMGLKLRGSASSAHNLPSSIPLSFPFICCPPTQQALVCPRACAVFQGTIREPSRVQASSSCPTLFLLSVLGSSFLGDLLVLILCSRSQLQALPLPHRNHHDSSYTVSR